MALAATAAPGITLAAPAPAPATSKADLVLYNGHVLTMDAQGTVAEAVAVAGDRIIAIGRTADLKALAGPGARAIDLEGRTLLPGLIDSRIHGALGVWEASTGASLLEADGSPMSRPESIETRLTQWIAEHKPAAGDWIVAAGFNPKLAISRGFDRTLADRIAPDNPLLMLSLDHRVAVVNGMAIDLGLLKGLDAKNDAQGAPTGLLREGSVLLLLNKVWALQPETARRDAMQRFEETAVRFGITTVGSPMMVPADLLTAESLISEGRMPVRLVAGALAANTDARAAFDDYRAAGKSPNADRLSIGRSLYQLDGTVLGWGAAQFQAYKDSGWTSGQLAMPPDAIDRLVRGATTAQTSGVTVDATGNLAVHVLFDALEKDPAAQIRADGLQVMTPGDRERLPRIAKTGLIVSLQPTRFPFRLFLQASLGEEQMAQALPYRALIDAGLPVAINSDWPMVAQTFKPVQLIEWSVTRAGWRAEEGLTVPQALRAYTSDAARALGLQDVIGSIEVGKKADLVVFDRDPLELAATPDQLSELAVRLTIAGGSIEFEDRPSARATAAASGTAGKSR